MRIAAFLLLVTPAYLLSCRLDDINRNVGSICREGAAPEGGDSRMRFEDAGKTFHDSLKCAAVFALKRRSKSRGINAPHNKRRARCYEIQRAARRSVGGGNCEHRNIIEWTHRNGKFVGISKGRGCHRLRKLALRKYRDFHVRFL